MSRPSRRLLELQVDGIVAVTGRLSRAALAEAARSTPLVTLTQTPRHRLAGQVRVTHAPPTERGGYDATRELLADTGTVTAIFAGNDLCAFGVLDALAEHGVRVPADISVAGYDNTPVASFRTISLTTVGRFAAEIGSEAMRSVLARIKRRDRPARHITVPPRLIKRATTGPPRGAAIPAPGEERCGR